MRFVKEPAAKGMIYKLNFISYENVAKLVIFLALAIKTKIKITRGFLLWVAVQLSQMSKSQVNYQNEQFILTLLHKLKCASPLK